LCGNRIGIRAFTRVRFFGIYLQKRAIIPIYSIGKQLKGLESMGKVNLDDLKIDHERGARKRGFPLFGMALLFVLGAAAGLGLVYFKPDFVLSLMRIQNEKTQAVTNDSTVPTSPTPTNGDGQPDHGETGKAGNDAEEPEKKQPAGFNEGGWIEVPSYHPVVVSSLIPGRLEELNVLEGSRVEKGDVIAVLYQKDIEDEVKKALAEVEAARAELARYEAGYRKQEKERARADLKSAEADVEHKEQVKERTEKLLETGAVSAEELERDLAAYRIAEAKAETLRQELLLKEEGYRSEEIQAAAAELEKRKALLALARNRFEYTVIKSPVSGVVLDRHVTPGTYIPAGDPKIVSLYDPTDLQVRVDVRQENIRKVYIGQETEIFTDAEPTRAYAGRVVRIDPLADFKKNTIQVKIKVLDPSDELHPEMIARIRFKRRDNEKSHGED